ncbi:MAG TPA: helix-turn-helix transcriptional regulator [Pirellulales bacterium]|jgi:transcriptional regulator with XRE-family HTH domain
MKVDLADQLRREVKKSGESKYAICKATGIDTAAMSRFMSGRRELSLSKASDLCHYFGLRLKRVGR